MYFIHGSSLLKDHFTERLFYGPVAYAVLSVHSENVPQEIQSGLVIHFEYKFTDRYSEFTVCEQTTVWIDSMQCVIYI